MSETPEPETAKPKPRKLLDITKPKRRPAIKPLEVVFIAGFIIVVITLLKVLIGDIAVKHEVNQGTALSDKVVSAMEKQNTVALRALGTKQFQKDHSAAELNYDLTFKTLPPITFGQMYGKNGKRSIIQQTAIDNASGQHVIVIYRYDKLKVPIFVRIITIKPPSSTKWYLLNLKISPDESSLFTDS